MLHLSALNIYPVKSLGGIALNQAVVTPRGLENDRRFLIIDDDARFLTQRQLPLMARLRTRMSSEHLEISANGDTLRIPLVSSGPRLRVIIWRQEVEAVALGEAAEAFLSAALETPCRLVWMPDDCERKVDEDYARNGEITSFSDGFPFLIFGENSLAALNYRLDEPVPADRFRANFQFSGGAAWDEDSWKRFRIGAVEFENLKPCARCIVTTIDQQTGARVGAEPLQTLATFRKRGGGVMFGVNLVARNGGEVKVGDEIEVLERFAKSQESN